MRIYAGILSLLISFVSGMASEAIGLVAASTKEYTGDGHVIVDGVVKYARFDGGYDYYPYGEPWREPAGQPFLYSGNERLRVDGLNEYDFNARRYNPVTTQFTTWDPFAEKYPWLSPYAYCAGNPIWFSDPTGEDWHISSNRDENGVLNINMTVNGVVYNPTSEKYNMNDLCAAIKNQIEDVFSFTGENYNVSMVANIRAVSDVNDINLTDHVFAIVYQSALSKNVLSVANGLMIRIGTKLIGQTLSGENRRSIAHELGHTGGLHDINISDILSIKDADTNLMTQIKALQEGVDKNEARNLEINQLNSIIRSYNAGKLNQKSPIWIKSYYGFSSEFPFILRYEKKINLKYK